MVIIEKITKKYGSRTLFENFSCQLGETGIYGIVGESGLGKTTLLNIISSLDNDYEGKIIINGVNLKELKENDLRNFRYQNFGFIFQSYNLFEDETVYNNILMVLEGNKTSKQIKNQNINDVLKYLDIENIKDEYVQNLSGGEKQRVAIARAIINNPKIIFCDEPTGALDEENSTQIFRILKIIANKSLVILVSHDYENVKKYADEIIDLKILEMNKNEPSYSTKETFFIPQTNKISARLSFKFMIRSIKNSLKIKKGRFLFSSLIFSLSLIFLGLTLYISSNVSESINKAFGNVINENSLVLEKKNNTEEVISYAASEEDINKIVDKYNEDIEYFGCKYLVNFPSFFVSQNNFYIENGDFPRLISFLSATNINEFNLLNKDVILNNTFYPKDATDNNLKNDEIIISIDYLNMEKLCSELQIVRSYESLGNYLKDNEVKLILKVSNDSWNYDDEQMFILKGVMQSPQTRIYHSNNLFNKIIFEDNMRLPTTNNMFEISQYPWIMKKVYYLKTKTFQTNFINKISMDANYKNYLFDPDNSTYSPSICSVGELCYSNRIFVYKSLNDIFSSSIINDIYETNNKFNNYYYSTYFGYVNYGTSLFNGFANQMFFSFDKNEIEKLIYELEKIRIKDSLNINVSPKIASGYALDSKPDNVKFSMIYDGKYEGKEDLNYNEIVISTELSNQLGFKNPIDRDLYLLLNYSKETDGKYYFNKFKLIKLKVVGVVDSKRLQIYQKSEFSLYLFRDFFEISAFNLIPNSIIYEFDEKPSEEEIRYINNKFRDYNLIDPFKPINDSIDEVFYYVNFGLIIFTIFSSLSTIVLLFVINTINFDEEKRSYAILQVLGFNDLEISKFQLLKNFSYTLPSLLTSSFSMIFISFFLSKIISETLGLSLTYAFPFSSMLGIYLLSIFLTVISFIFNYFHNKKYVVYSSLH